MITIPESDSNHQSLYDRVKVVGSRLNSATSTLTDQDECNKKQSKPDRHLSSVMRLDSCPNPAKPSKPTNRPGLPPRPARDLSAIMRLDLPTDRVQREPEKIVSPDLEYMMASLAAPAESRRSSDFSQVCLTMTDVAGETTILKPTGKKQQIAQGRFAPEPLTKSNKLKAADAIDLLNHECWPALPEILKQDPGLLIGLRVNARVNKPTLFNEEQRGVVTDIHKAGRRRVFIVITWDNLSTGRQPMQRTVKFASEKFWKYVKACY